MKLSELIAPLSLKSRFNQEVLWNLASFAVLAVSGLLMNVIIFRARGEEALGVFNQVFAFYTLLSQFAVLGVHFSALKHVSHNQDDRARCADISTAAVVLVSAISLAVAIATYALRNVAAGLWESPGVGVGLALVAPGLVFFALNKVLLNVLNGLRYMRAYAAFQALRIVLILAVMMGLIVTGRPADYLAASLTIAELVLLVILAVYSHVWLMPFTLSGRLKGWIVEHVRFGLRGCLSGALDAINMRIGVLMLGLLCSDAIVGVYSFAALLAEGFSQIAMVLRRVIDPILGARFAAGQTELIAGYASKIRWTVYPLMTAVTVVAVAVYPLGLRIVAPGDSLSASWMVFAILMIGILLNVGYRPFLGILLQAGRPGTHTMLIAILVLTNCLLNALLIPILQIHGAAIATGLVYVLEAVLIMMFARRYVGIQV